MSVVVTVMNMKGGVGKTTIAMHIAGIAPRFRSGRKVLAIDYDPQFNMSQAFLPAREYFNLEKIRKTTIAILIDDDSDLNPYHIQVPGNLRPPSVNALASRIYTSRRDGAFLDIVPSTLDLMYVALGQANTQIAPIEERFEKFIAECKTIYDLILIDCHPAGSLFTKTSLGNSDHVVIPVIPSGYAARGIGLMMNFIAAQKVGAAAPQPHILFNATPRAGVAPLETQIRSDPHFTKYCMNNTLKWYKAFSEPEGGAGFVWSSGKPYSTKALGNLLQVTRELMSRIGA